MGIFIYAFTATGKSSVARKYSNVIDMESTLYKYLDVSTEDETTKGTDRKLNKLWPNNYFEVLEKIKDKYDYILIADEICDDYLSSNNYEYWWVYPSENLKDEYLDRCKKRGNNDEFICWYSELWDEWINKCKNDKSASKYIGLKSNI